MFCVQIFIQASGFSGKRIKYFRFPAAFGEKKMNQNDTSLFRGKSSFYAAGRPRYAPGLLDYLEKEERLCGKTVADIGSGTGIFSAQLLERGNTVYGIEPDDGMRAEAERSLGECERFSSIRGSAESTGLPEASVDAVTAAQAFHWFDPAAFREECRRILRPGGKVFLLWNNNGPETERDREWNREEKRIFDTCCPPLPPGRAGRNIPEAVGNFFKTYEEFCFENVLKRTKEQYIAACLSVSCALRKGEEGFDAFVHELERFFDRRSDGGILVSQARSVLYAGYV